MFLEKGIQKAVKKMQQGGLTVFAPEPNQYRAPIPGVDPNIYRFNPTASFDMSPLLEMQKQQQAVQMQRQNAALAREKMMHQSLMQERKLAAESEKEMLSLLGDNYSKSGGQATDKDGNILYAGDDIRTSARFAPLFQEAEAKKMEIFDQISHVKSLPHNTPNKINILARLMDEYKRIQTSTPATAEMEADSRAYHSVMKAYSDPSGKTRVNRTLATDYLNNRAAYYRNEPGSDKLYKLGQYTPGLLYDYEVGKKAFDDALQKLNSPFTVSESVDMSGNLIKEVKDTKIMDTDVAANTLADLVLSQPDLRAYIQDMYGVSLYSKSPDDPLAKDDKKVLSELLKPIISYDDQMQTFGVSSTASYKGQISKPDSEKTQESVKDEASSILSSFSSRYYDSKTGKMVADVPQSELGKAASALTTTYTNVYGGDASSNESRTKLDRISFEFLQAGGNPADTAQTRVLQDYYNKILYVKDIEIDMEGFKAELQAAAEESARKAWNPVGGSGTTSSSSANVSTTNKSASDLAKMASGQ